MLQLMHCGDQNGTRDSRVNVKGFYLSKSSSTNHLQGLKVLQTQSSAFQTQKLGLSPRVLRAPHTFLQTDATFKYSTLCEAHSWLRNKQ